METLKDESIAMQREPRFEQVQPFVERQVIRRGFPAQPQVQRFMKETFPLAFATAAFRMLSVMLSVVCGFVRQGHSCIPADRAVRG